MLIVAWVMSDPVNCELMGRPVMQKEMTYVCYSSSGPHCLLPVGGRTTPSNQVRLASSTGQIDWPMAIETHISYQLR